MGFQKEAIIARQNRGGVALLVVAIPGLVFW
jgi:hypothetical protein